MDAIKKGETQHTVKKLQYTRSNKNTFEKQITGQSEIIEKIRLIEENVAKVTGQSCNANRTQKDSTIDEEAEAELTHKYRIAAEKKNWIIFGHLIHSNQLDPAVNVSAMSIYNSHAMLYNTDI